MLLLLLLQPSGDGRRGGQRPSAVALLVGGGAGGHALLQLDLLVLHCCLQPVQSHSAVHQRQRQHGQHKAVPEQ